MLNTKGKSPNPDSENLYIGSFRFEYKDNFGTFNILAQAKTTHKAERIFRKYIESISQKSELLKPGTHVFILDITEVQKTDEPILFQMVKENKDGNSIFYSGLPLAEPNAQHFSISMPQELELFLEIQ